jgi:hypothetical protein
MPKQFICPMPMVWDRIYQNLQAARDCSPDQTIPRPPIPLILNGWVYSTDLEKASRWNETIDWAKQYGFADLIPELQEDESHYAND